MKKFFLIFMMMLTAVVSKAQFEAGTKFASLSATGLGVSYSTNEKFRFGMEATAGYFVADKVLVKANLGYNHTNNIDDFSLGLGGRYYFIENGIFLGAGAEFNHYTPSSNDVQIPVEIGYTFYLNHYIAIEPAAYYKMSLHDFSNNSTVGIKLGFSVYF